MSTAIRVPLEGNPAGKLEEIRQRCKQLRADVKDTERDMSSLARTGQAVSKEISDKYQKVRADLKSMEELGKKAREQEKQISELQKRVSSTTGSIGRGDIHKARAFTELAEGKVSPRSLHAIAEAIGETGVGRALGIGKLADTLGNVSGPTMIADMVLQQMLKNFSDETDLIKSKAINQNASMKLAESLGIDPSVRRAIVERTRSRLASTRAKEYGDQREDLDVDTLEAQKDDERELEQESAKEMSEVKASRKHLKDFGLSADFVSRRTQRESAKGANFSSTEFMTVLDQALAKELESPEGRKIFEEKVEGGGLTKEQKEWKREKENRAQRMEFDPDFAQSERNKAAVAQMAFNLHHARYGPAPTD